MPIIIVWGTMEALAEHREELLQLALEHTKRSRLEPGCIKHSIQVDAENANKLVFYEEWQDMSALKTHFKVPASNQFVVEAKKLCVGKGEMQLFEANKA